MEIALSVGIVAFLYLCFEFWNKLITFFKRVKDESFVFIRKLRTDFINFFDDIRAGSGGIHKFVYPHPGINTREEKIKVFRHLRFQWKLYFLFFYLLQRLVDNIWPFLSWKKRCFVFFVFTWSIGMYSEVFTGSVVFQVIGAILVFGVFTFFDNFRDENDKSPSRWTYTNIGIGFFFAMNWNTKRPDWYKEIKTAYKLMVFGNIILGAYIGICISALFSTNQMQTTVYILVCVLVSIALGFIFSKFLNLYETSFEKFRSSLHHIR